MRRTLVLGLVFLNALLASTILVHPVSTQLIPNSGMDCCHEDPADEDLLYCCFGCCWFTNDCDTDKDCQDTKRS